MPSTYSNPQSLLTPTDFKLTGPAAGALSSMKDMYAFSDMDAANRDQDLGYLMTLNKYQNQLADNPLIEAKRQNELGTQGIINESIKSGLQNEAYTSGLKAETAANQAKESADKLARSITGANSFVSLKEYLDSIAPDSSDEKTNLALLNDPNHQRYVEQLRKQAKEAGTPFPEGNVLDPAVRAQIDARYNAAKNALPHLRAMEMATTKTQAQYENVIAPKIASAERIAAGNREAANMRKQWEIANNRTIEAAYNDIIKKPELTLGDVETLRVFYEDKFSKLAEGKSPLQFFYTQDPTLKSLIKESDKTRAATDPMGFVEALRKDYVETSVERATAGKKIKAAEKPSAQPTTQQQTQPTENAEKPVVRQTSGSIGGQATEEPKPAGEPTRGNTREPAVDRPDLRAKGYVWRTYPKTGWYKD